MYGNNSEDQERKHHDSVYNKNIGETYREADQRRQNESNARRDEHNRATQEAADSTASRNQSHSGGYSGSGASPYVAPSERRQIAKIFSTIGWGLLLVAVIIWFFGISVPPVFGLPMSEVAIYGAIFCLVFGYLAELIAIVMWGFAILEIYWGAHTSEGFALGNVSAKNWGGVAMLVIGGFIIGRIFGRKLDKN